MTLHRLFGFDRSKTDLKTELFAGLTSFLTMSYILAVNPNLFSQLDGMPAGSVFTTTALISIISTLLVAFVAKMPFGIAPGMSSNSFFVFTICMGMGCSWQLALTAVLIESVILILLTVTGLRVALVNALPTSIKQSITIGIGLFIAFVGMQNAGIVVQDPSTLVRLGDITHGSGLLAVIGLLITGTLNAFKIKGGMLIGILITTVIGIPFGITQYQGLISVPQSIEPILCQFDWSSVFSSRMLVVVMSFLFIDLFSLTGSAVAVCDKAGMTDSKGQIPGINRLFLADSLGTLGSGVFGTSSVCTLIESSSGVAQGGKSGLTAFTIAVCFAAALFFSPLFLAIPSAATAPVLIIVGLNMFSSVRQLDLDDFSESLPAFITIITMPLCYSITDGILIGVISYVAINALCGNFRKLSPATCILAAIFVLKYILLDL